MRNELNCFNLMLVAVVIVSVVVAVTVAAKSRVTVMELGKTTSCVFLVHVQPSQRAQTLHTLWVSLHDEFQI